jgi:hypothetical protein
VLIAIDVGRNSVKVAYKLKVGGIMMAQFPSVTAKGFSKFSSDNNQTSNYYSGDTPLAMKFNGEDILYGKYAEVQGNQESLFSPVDDSEQFHSYATNIIIFVCAKLLLEEKVESSDSNLDLGLDLTFENDDNDSRYKKIFREKDFSVEVLKIVNGTKHWEQVKFKVNSVLVSNQGYASIFNFLETENEALIINKTGVVVDIGKFSLNLVLIKEFMIVKSLSVPLGTLSLSKKLVDRARLNGIALSSKDIDFCFENGSKDLKTLSGTYNPTEDANSSGLSSQYFSQIQTTLVNFLSEGEGFQNRVSVLVDYIMIVGGGAYLVKDALVKGVNTKVLTGVEPKYANALGLLKFLGYTVD